MDYENIREAQRIGEEVKYHLEEYLPLRFGSSESSFLSKRPIKPFYLLIMLLYAMYRVQLAAAKAHIETNDLSQKLLERLIVEKVNIPSRQV